MSESDGNFRFKSFPGLGNEVAQEEVAPKAPIEEEVPQASVEDSTSEIEEGSQLETVEDFSSAISGTANEDFEDSEVDFSSLEEEKVDLDFDYGIPESFSRELAKNRFSAKPQKVLISPYNNHKEDGESCALIFTDQVVIMWRKFGQLMTYLSFTDEEITEFAIEYDADGSDLLALVLSNSNTSFYMWLEGDQFENISTFTNYWYDRVEYNSANPDEKPAPSQLEKEVKKVATVSSTMDTEPDIDLGDEDLKPQVKEEFVHSHTGEEGYVDDLQLSLQRYMEENDLDEVPKTVLFIACIISCFSDDDGNMDSEAHRKLEMIVSNNNLFIMSLDYLEENDLEGCLTDMKRTFSLSQQEMVLTNLIDIVYRLGDPDPVEYNYLDQVIEFLEFDYDRYMEILSIFQVKNNLEILVD